MKFVVPRGGLQGSSGKQTPVHLHLVMCSAFDKVFGEVRLKE